MMELKENESAYEYKNGYIIVERFDVEADNLVWFNAYVEHEGWDTNKCAPGLRTAKEALIAGRKLYDEYKRQFGWD